ncbi:E3 ubiquitin-protein ligase uhrf1 [Gryganskiella cystojenkinii]|nr:E3 ubiquitin-protein ligase uhrf1 [Gryganskiella cystojenkinii]
MRVKILVPDQANTAHLIRVPSSSTTINQLRRNVAKILQAEMANIKLFHSGQLLVDGKTLFECGISDLKTVHVSNNAPISEQSTGVSEGGSTISDNQTPLSRIERDACSEVSSATRINAVRPKQMARRTKPFSSSPRTVSALSTAGVTRDSMSAPEAFDSVSAPEALLVSSSPPSSSTAVAAPLATEAPPAIRALTLQPTHKGPIPGIPVGSSWRWRKGCSKAGVHRPPIAGIAGSASTGAVSIVLAAGYPDDVDEGMQFTYTGAGGKVGTSSIQNADQKLESVNEALARTCHGKFSKHGATAYDWRKSDPVRVIRSAKLKKHNPSFAPEEGNRYDGIYKLEKMRRDDDEPAPWTEEGKDRIRELGLVMDCSEGEPVRTGSLETNARTKKYKIPADFIRLMTADTANAKIWESIQDMDLSSDADLLSAVFEREFQCPICQDVIDAPVTTACGHNICREPCLNQHIRNKKKLCDDCPEDWNQEPKTVNKLLEQILCKLLDSAKKGSSKQSSPSTDSSTVKRRSGHYMMPPEKRLKSGWSLQNKDMRRERLLRSKKEFKEKLERTAGTEAEKPMHSKEQTAKPTAGRDEDETLVADMNELEVHNEGKRMRLAAVAEDTTEESEVDKLKYDGEKTDILKNNFDPTTDSRAKVADTLDLDEKEN